MSQLWSTPHLVGGRRQVVRPAGRRLYFEPMEPREMLAADVAVGAPNLTVGSTGGMTGSIGGSVLTSHAAADCADHDALIGLTDVRVQLLDAVGAVVEEVATDEQGNYQFLDLIPGNYTVRRVLAASELGTNESLEQNEIAAIDLQGGEQLTDFDFCQFEVTTANEPPSQAAQLQLAAILGIVQTDMTSTITPALVTSSNTIYEPANETLSLPALATVQPVDFYGGSSRELKTSKSIKSWNEFPSLDLSSTLSLIDATGQQQTVEALLGKADDQDSAFVDGYLVNSLEWLDTADDVELRELIGDEAIIDVASEAPVGSDAEITPQVAQRSSPTSKR